VTGRYADAAHVLGAALFSLEPEISLNWAWIAQQDAVADESVAAGRTRTSGDQLVEAVGALVIRSS
jgi:hypothetical protein